MRDPHEILGVPWDADPRHIKAAYKRRVAQLHPDRNKAPDAAERLKEVIEAYSFLKDPGQHFRKPAPQPADTAIDPVELRRRHQFQYLFEKLIRPQTREALLPWPVIRRMAAIGIAAWILVAMILNPAFMEFQNSDTLLDEVLMACLLGLYTSLIVVSETWSELTVYSPSRRGPSVATPPWLIELCGWVLLLSLPAMLRILHTGLL